MSSNEHEPDVADDETAVTEISFLPDGRICLFGASREIVELLCQLDLGDPSLLARHLSVQSSAKQSHIAESNETRVMT